MERLVRLLKYELKNLEISVKICIIQTTVIKKKKNLKRDVQDGA